MTAALDHIVVNTLTGMDAAAALFEALGFSLTPRGYHTLGSINHLMMTRGPYLELVGVPPTGLQRADVLESPLGLNGLVFNSGDAETTFRDLRAKGLDPSKPVAFSRPVRIGANSVEARFRTVRLPAAAFPAGRVYFCEHLTPDYVWRQEWFGHPNGFQGFTTLTVESPDPEAEAIRYEVVCDTSAARIDNGYRFVADGCAIDLVAGPASRFASVGLLFGELDDIRNRASGLPEITWREEGGLAVLGIPSLQLTFECRSVA
ncbi:hypothetical protein J2046_004007 [Rhizobium petrolearium]|uniref:VOC family protein n=1 Tax=Neorhizobium petrolearium TaxID=515361 RepID=UPI001AE4062F|nr:VOC family protein [Neorhizobium petrolearium]MBP1845733.1 hypothetical protein [Neorhizobium petrolearium]